MSQTTTRQWGLTPPLSDTLPSTSDMEKNAQLIEELKRENNYERSEETQKRMDTLKLLSRIHQEFVKEVSRRQRLPQSQVDQFGGKIYPYGSYRLGVYGPGSDIDTLAVAPRHVKREDFFELFPPILRRMAGVENIQSLTAVPDSFVPIIKLILNNIEIDLIFVSITTLQTIPKNLELKDNKLLDGLDQAGIKSITGPRVTDEILSLVPEHKTFRTALRAIKLWAQRRAIYANIVGFPGGVAWAMLVARVCQLYPHANGATIVTRFFFVMKDWPWPTPVMLKEIETGKEKVWNPQIYPGDRKNIMPIITPAYPSMCATFNISKSGKNVIQRELEKGFFVADGIFKGTQTWADLFKKHTFFAADHKYYLSIIASSCDADAAKAWSGLVESKVRHLVMQLELQADIISLARPYTKGFKRTHRVDSSDQINEVRKGSMKYKVDETTMVETTDPELVATNGDGTAADGAGDARILTTEGDQTVYTYTFYIGLDLTDKAVKNLNISAPIQYFKNMCATWTGFNPQVHDINVAPCKNYELPTDVFDAKAGEIKPVKPAKKVKKRAASEAETAISGQGPKRQAMMDVNGTPTPVTPAPA